MQSIPTVKIGGPSFQEIQADNERPRDLRGNSAWLSRFLRYLDSHGRARDYQFFSFEWYPFDEICEPVAPQLARAPDLLTEALREMQRRGLSRRLPWIISEYGYSAFASRAEISIEGALLNADIVGKFLSLGGDQAFLFGYTPAQVLRDAHCTAGNNMMLLMDEDGDIRQTFATYFGARLMTQEWTMPTGGVHELYPAVSNVRNTEGEELVTGYVVHRPDGLWSLMLINKDPNLAYKVRVNFRNELTRKTSTFDGAVDVYQFSGAQYEMNNDMNNPAPTRALAPQHTGIEGYNSSSFDLPAYSLTVIRGRDSANESRKPR